MFDKIMDHIDESSAVEDFDNRPSKKIKCSEPEFLDSDRKLNSDPIPSPASPSIQKLSPIIELEDKQACEIDDDQQLQDDKQIKVDTYDYVPQDKQMAELIDDEKQLEDYKQNKVSTYDYLP